MSTSKKKRITFKVKCPNPLFMTWLEQLYEKSVAKNINSQHSIKLAMKSLRKYPVSLESGSECAILKGFGNHLCQYLDNKLQSYNSQCNPVPTPSLDTSNIKTTDGNVSGNTVILKDKMYKPGYRTGSFAILVTLLKASQEVNYKGYLTKEEIIDRAQEYCEESMTRAKAGSHYTAWSSMSTLVRKGFVEILRKTKNQYSLSTRGLDLAFDIYVKHSDAIASGYRRTTEIVPINESIIYNTDESEHQHGETSGQSMQLQYKEDTLEANSPRIDSKSTECLFEFLPYTYEIILLVDKQETTGQSKTKDPTMHQLEKYKMIKYELRHLKVGDFTWIARNNNSNQEIVLPYIVERKRMDDLASSIKDGRFHEQKHRLKNCGIPNVIYLIENHENDKRIGLPISSLMQAVVNTRIQDNFMTHITSSLSGSVKFLAMMTKDLSDNFSSNTLMAYRRDCISEDFFDRTPPRLMTFSEFNMAASKTKPCSVKEMFVKQLLQLKGMSVEKALAIVSNYDTTSKLMNAFDASSLKCSDSLLANVKYGLEDRNIGPSLSRTLHQLFSRNILL